MLALLNLHPSPQSVPPTLTPGDSYYVSGFPSTFPPPLSVHLSLIAHSPTLARGGSGDEGPLMGAVTGGTGGT